jgi:hypothetical protein
VLDCLVVVAILLNSWKVKELEEVEEKEEETMEQHWCGAFLTLVLVGGFSFLNDYLSRVKSS